MEPINFGRRLKVLVCDDDPSIHTAFKLIFEDHDAVYVTNGNEAVQLARTQPFDAILVDINLPRVNGIDVLKQIRQFNPDLPVIMATGYASPEIAQAVAHAGASDYVVKPFAQKEIFEALARVLPRSPRPSQK